MRGIELQGLQEAYRRISQGGGVAYTNALTQHVEKFYAEAHELMLAKNHDYAGSLDPLANFRALEPTVDVVTGIMVRMSDKWSRLKRLVWCDDEARITAESLHDTLQDLSNYAAILDFELMEETYGPKDVRDEEPSVFLGMLDVPDMEDGV